MGQRPVTSWTCDRDPAHKVETEQGMVPARWKHVAITVLTGVETGTPLVVEYDVCPECAQQVERLLQGPKAPMFTRDPMAPERPRDTVQVA